MSETRDTRPKLLVLINDSTREREVKEGEVRMARMRVCELTTGPFESLCPILTGGRVFGSL